MNYARIFAATSLLTAPLACAPVYSQAQAPLVLDSAGRPTDATIVVCSSTDGTSLVACGSGGGGGGSGTEYTKDAAAPTNPLGGTLQCVRRDTPTTGEVSANGDWMTVLCDDKGSLRLRAVELETILGSPFQAGGSIGNTSFGATQSGTWNITNVSGTVSLPTGASTSANQTTLNSHVDGLETLVGTSNTNLGAPGDAPCATDTGSCAINAKLSRIAERLTTAITSLGTIDGRVDGLEAAIGAIGDSAWSGTGNSSLIAAAKAQYAAAVDASAVAVKGGPVTVSSCSITTVTTGGTAVTAEASDSARRYLFVQNPIGASETLFVNIGATATTTGNSYELAAGGVLEFGGTVIPTELVSVIAATSAHRYICKTGA